MKRQFGFSLDIGSELDNEDKQEEMLRKEMGLEKLEKDDSKKEVPRKEQPSVEKRERSQKTEKKTARKSQEKKPEDPTTVASKTVQESTEDAPLPQKTPSPYRSTIVLIIVFALIILLFYGYTKMIPDSVPRVQLPSQVSNGSVNSTPSSNVSMPSGGTVDENISAILVQKLRENGQA